MTASFRVLVVGLVTGAALVPAAAADLGTYRAPVAYAAPVQPLSFVSEIRIGGAVQDPGSAEGKARGFSTENVNGEVLLAKPVVFQDPFWQAFIPRPTVGGSYNTGGRTSYAYLGATWTVEILPETLGHRIFLDGFFGGAAHNGYTGPKPPDGALDQHGDCRAHVECRALRQQPRPDELRRQARLHVLRRAR